MYHENEEEGGRPHIDEILMVKMLLLQGWYGLSDYEAERQANDRISFRHFLGYPETIPDRSTLWRFRERLNDQGKVHKIWDELQRQLDEKGYRVKRGTIQDATFITTDPGHAPSDKPRGDEAKTRRSRDGKWGKKGSKSQFGYKLHSLIDINYRFIRRFDGVTQGDNWFFDYAMDGSINKQDRFSQLGDIPLVGDFNKDGTMDRAVFRGVTTGNNWFFDYKMDATIDKQDRFGQIGDLPLIWIL